MATSSLTASENRELEMLEFSDANYGLTVDEQRRYDELRNKSRD